MLDENEFKPFTLNDFSVADAASENTKGISTPTQNLANSDQIESFEIKPSETSSSSKVSGLKDSI